MIAFYDGSSSSLIVDWKARPRGDRSHRPWLPTSEANFICRSSTYPTSDLQLQPLYARRLAAETFSSFVSRKWVTFDHWSTGFESARYTEERGRNPWRDNEVPITQKTTTATVSGDDGQSSARSEAVLLHLNQEER